MADDGATAAGDRDQHALAQQQHGSGTLAGDGEDHDGKQVEPVDDDHDEADRHGGHVEAAGEVAGHIAAAQAVRASPPPSALPPFLQGPLHASAQSK